MTDRFEIGFEIDHDINPRHEVMSIRMADELADEAEKRGKKGVILCQVFLSDTSDNASIKGRFISYEASLEIAKVMQKYGYETDVTHKEKP